VECEYCHVQGAFEKDDKKTKGYARGMMDLMFDINKNHFEGHREVTCNTCHRGSPDPMGIPAILAENEKAPEPKKESEEGNKPPAGPSPDQIFDKFLLASGGAAVSKVTSRVQKGTIDFDGHSFPIDVYTKAPSKRISLTHMSSGDNITAFTGSEGWMGMPGRPLREMHGPDLDAAAIDADLHLPADLKQMISKADFRGTEKIGDHEVYQLFASREGKTPLRLYFDTQSGLLVRMVRYGETALGRLPTQIDYADYRDVDGVKVPFRWTLARPSGRFTIQITETKQNVPVDDAKFTRPAASAEPPKGPAK